MELYRCPNYYLNKLEPELNPWVNMILELYSWREKGCLEMACPNPSLKTIEAIDIVATEINRQQCEDIKEANEKMKKK